MTEDEIVKIAQNIEMSLYKLYPDCGSRYKAKCKAICFNISDSKNLVRFQANSGKTFLFPELFRVRNHCTLVRFKYTLSLLLFLFFVVTVQFVRTVFSDTILLNI